MGQKVNPVGFRILTNYNWDSVWYSDINYADNLLKDIKIRDKILKDFKEAAISKVLIERVGNNVNLIIKTAKPGVLIGKKGTDIEKIKEQIKRMGERDVTVKIVEIDKPDMDSKVVALSIAKQIEARAAYKRVIKKAIQTAMRYGIQGIKIKIGGRLNGADIARTETFKDGSIPLHTIKADIDYATAEANSAMGIIGIKVWICKNKDGNGKKVSLRGKDIRKKD